jgi:hypothetical protein
LEFKTKTKLRVRPSGVKQRKYGAYHYIRIVCSNKHFAKENAQGKCSFFLSYSRTINEPYKRKEYRFQHTCDTTDCKPNFTTAWIKRLQSLSGATDSINPAKMKRIIEQENNTKNIPLNTVIIALAKEKFSKLNKRISGETDVLLTRRAFNEVQKREKRKRERKMDKVDKNRENVQQNKRS